MLLGSSVCLGGTIDPSVSDDKYIAYGDQHECVVPIFGKCGCSEAEKGHSFAASAVVISKRWVVTAAHVVNGTSNVKVRVRGREHAMKRVLINKHFREDKVGLYDIAMCESEDDMDLDFYPELYVGKDEKGKVASICGYGMTGTFGTGAKSSDKKKRAGSNMVDECHRHVIACSISPANKTEMEFLIASGDSGGGLFIDQKLAGINSFVAAVDGSPNSDYGDESNHTRVSLFVPWIKANMRGEESSGEVE